MNQTLAALTAVLTYGALWGITEASIGHLLHITGFFYGWLFWFPAAYVFMHQAYRRTGSPSTAVGAAIVAASIKLIDLLAPVRLDFVINPAVSILLEGAVVCIVLGLPVRLARKWHLGAVGALLMSMAWRGLYLLYALLLVPANWRAISPLISTQALLQFVVVESMVNAMFILLKTSFIKQIFNMPYWISSYVIINWVSY
jgi:hypothetical protein